MTVVIVMYPAGGSFDHEYYMKTHMPLVDRQWGSLGMSGWRVMRGQPGPDGAAPAYQVVTELTFSSMDAFKAAAAAHGAEIMGDVPNFTDIQPAMQFNEVVAA